MFIKLAGTTIADIADGVTTLVDIVEMPGLRKRIDRIAPKGSPFARPFDGGGAEISIRLRVDREFRLPEDVFNFALAHILELSKKRRGLLEIEDFDGLKYCFRGAVLETATPGERVGVSCVYEYNFIASGVGANI